MKATRVTKEDILSIRAGQTKIFPLEDNAACNAARVHVQYIKRVHLPKNIQTYETKVDWETHCITITAIAKK